jgi:hypothetical protein
MCNRLLKNTLLKLTFKISISILFLTLAFEAHAKDVTIFEVRRPLSMENNKVNPKDYFINAGKADGIKVGTVFKVVRRQSLYDAYQQKSPEELAVYVGELRIIHVQNEISVARLEEIYDREKLPTLEVDSIMVGDRVDMTSGRAAPTKTASLDVTPQPMQLQLILPPANSGSTNVNMSTGTADFSSQTLTPSTQSQPL